MSDPFSFIRTIDKEAGTIHVAAVAESNGYVAFGLAESGGMPGADMVAYSHKGGKLVDYHATDYAAPIEDSCNDWTLVGHTMTDDGLMIWEGVQNLVMGDNQDHDIVDDSAPTIPQTRIIGAWGNSDTDGALTYHSPQNRVKFEVRLSGNNAGLSTAGFYESMAAEAEGSFFVGSSEYALNNENGGQPVATEYTRVCVLLKDLVDDPLVEAHIIGFKPVIDKIPNLHHLVLHASENREACGLGSGLEDVTIEAWAAGQGPHELPKEAGFPMGGDNGYHSFEIGIHYDNAAMIEGIIDSSGLKVHYTTKKRTLDAGVFQVGDPYVQLDGNPVGEGITKHVFSCPSECSSFEDEVEDVTIFGQSLHMHTTGTRMIQETLRDGEVMHSSSVDYYDFNQMGMFNEQLAPFQLKRGDAFRTACMYGAKESTVFGLGSEDEMCITFFHYYPKQSTMVDCIYLGDAAWGLQYHPCLVGEYTKTELNGEEEVGRFFGTVPDQCSLEEIPPANSTGPPTP